MVGFGLRFQADLNHQNHTGPDHQNHIRTNTKPIPLPYNAAEHIIIVCFVLRCFEAMFSLSSTAYWLSSTALHIAHAS